MMQFFLAKKDFFDFDWKSDAGIMLVDPFFLKDGKVVCSTLSHEKYLDILEELL